jgi:hypothetical protein
MRKYDKLYAAIKKDMKQSDPKLNDFLKCFSSCDKGGVWLGHLKWFDQKEGKKCPHKCKIELNDTTVICAD